MADPDAGERQDVHEIRVAAVPPALQELVRGGNGLDRERAELHAHPVIHEQEAVPSDPEFVRQPALEIGRRHKSRLRVPLRDLLPGLSVDVVRVVMRPQKTHDVPQVLRGHHVLHAAVLPLR